MLKFPQFLHNSATFARYLVINTALNADADLDAGKKVML